MAENARPAARSAPLFAAFCLVTLLLAASPLAISPPVDVKVSGPALVAADQEARFRGSYTAAGIGLAGRPVEVILDGNPLATLTTADDGSFEIVVPAKRAGPHVLAVVASRGGYLEATSGTLRFRAVSAPLAVTSLALSGSALSWRLPTPDEDRPIQEVRVYAQSPGEPWRKVATLPPDAAAFDASQASGARSFGVVALNVAGESPWATVSR